MSFAEPHEHDFSVDVHAGEGVSAYLSQRLDRVAVHLDDAPDGVSGREHSSETRCNEYVAGLHVCVSG
jgi:hypothetical protein